MPDREDRFNWTDDDQVEVKERGMLPEPRCYQRRCVYFWGVVQSDGTERTEVVACDAFPEGIPDKIAYGTNLHLRPVEGDNGIQYEKAPADVEL